jgi:uncharacterized membrane-anchored protein
MNPPMHYSTIDELPIEEEIFVDTFGNHAHQPGHSADSPAGNHTAMHDRWDKLPAVVGFFWVLKIAATTLGETGGDLFAQTLKFGYGATSVVMFSLLFMTLAAQMRTRSYKPWIYWSVILLTSTAGTTMSDFINRTLKFGYAKGSAILIALLFTTLAIWRAVEGNLDVKHVRSRRAEVLYWTAILFSNTLGTSLGDYLADSSGLGFGGGALLVGSVMLAVLAAYRYTKISRVGLFWIAFVLTRPLGATAGDLFTKTHAKGGMGFGTKGTSALLAAILAGCIIYANNQLKSRRLAAAA